MNKQIFLLSSLILLTPSISHSMLQQQAAQPANQAVQAANNDQTRQLGLLAARVLIDQPRRAWYADTPAREVFKTQDHFCKDAIAVETKNLDYAFNHLFENVGSIYSHHFPQIVAHDILRQVNSRPAFILSHGNLLTAVLPKITSKNISEQKKQSVFFTLALTLFNSPEFRHTQATYFPNIPIEPDQLNLEQILLLLLIAPSQNHHPLLISVSQANAHNILTQGVFKTLPQPLQQTLRAQLSPLQINHLALRNVMIFTMLDTLGLFLQKPKELTFPVPGITEKSHIFKNEVKWLNYKGFACISLDFLLPLLRQVQPQQRLFLGTCFTLDLNIKLKKLAFSYTTDIALHCITEESLSSKLGWLLLGRYFLKGCALVNAMPGILPPRLTAALANLARLNIAVEQIEYLPYYTITRLADWLAFRAAAFEAAHR